jgi:hypothetical protein
MQNTQMFCGQNTEFLYIKAGGTKSLRLQKVKQTVKTLIDREIETINSRIQYRSERARRNAASNTPQAT